MTKTRLLYDAFEVPDRDLSLEEVPEGTTCSVTGEPIREGVRSKGLLTSATAGPHEIFPNATSNHCSWEAAQCYKYFKGGLTGNLLAVGDDSPEGWKPMISKSSARRKDRPCWQAMVYGTDEYAPLTEGMTCLAVCTEEFQRRLWLDTEVSAVGPHWKPYLFNGSTRRPLEIDFDDLRRVLALCEYVYTLGFTKEQIQASLLGAMSKADLMTEIGLARVRQLDGVLDEWRGTDELRLAAFICQRADFDVTDDFPSQIKALDASTDLCQMIPSPTKSTKERVTISSEKQKPRTETGSPTQQAELFS